jgi:hypothetical protein
MEKLKPEAEIEDEISLHEKGWIVQRVGWTILFILLTAASFGIFGSGVVSTKKLVKNGASVKFERFARFESPMILEIHTQNNTGKIEILLPLSYFSSVELEKIHPHPSAQRVENGAVVYLFSASNEVAIKFRLTPQSTGKISTVVKINQEDFPIDHFIYP